ncbi:hypothetical protein PHIM7_84 [Sinorhizobium phage phiM7]|uniref:Proximal tail sheath stabilization n=3 Tax=Emdodecavirus TaxID=1980937 RepID=S5MCV9_9CAUD|nr:proximal tail sheath stabilization [Sinorhizobium phage phiM12]YP_009212339.1 proximal tail sheath stabilization [Sinorhizobium phage phiN3]YP_009601209.1 hypothetical protein FDH46_gp084 [Sinorhizobium phage phiM7]AKF13267.1 proximal tail sheath stabilization [Sinorhizobium phage phiM19]AGR47749.1 proximal tail sheath stabilization [Sinorhizobium phage phiM12]AKF12907.1 hypothetical protein PHIM7_84 [Sinorhizobium phage phiM7]AKF13363.1 proximal tail sheath stabilization [Sinorhizobium ph
MLGYEWYNESLKKYTAIFGTLFNDVIISRKNDAGVVEKRFKVPIDFAPYQKFLIKLKQDPDLNKPAAIQLPRMAYEITSYAYDAENKIGNQGFRTRNNTGSVRYTGVPYNIEFSLYILTKYIEDGNKIVEQILPFFRPDWTSTVQFFPDDPTYLIDVPLVLNSVTQEDAYEDSFEERRVIMWTLNFTMRAQFFGPNIQRKLIKFVKVDTYPKLEDNDVLPDSRITVQPGMDADGNPTTDINSTIPYLQIDPDDDWAYIVQMYDKDELQ